MLDIAFWSALIASGFLVGGALIWIINLIAAPADRWLRKRGFC